MNTITKRPKQLTLALAVLAIIAAAAAILLSSGGSPAQATAGTLLPDGNKDGAAPRPLATLTPPTHATPEPCPEEPGNTNTQARVVSTGHIALFDVYWNEDEEELTNNPCPPTVEHVPGTSRNPARDDRTESNINIVERTIIHIPNSAQVDLNDPNTPYPRAQYRELWTADDAENLGGDGDRNVWVVPACPPDGPSTSDLCLAFSAALLNPEDWRDPEGAASDNGKVQYQIDHVHQIDIDRQDPRYVLTYPVSEAGSNARIYPIWNTSDADINVTKVAPGGYERPDWFFTSPGTYEFQVHIKGHPKHAANRIDGLDEVSEENSVTSDVREYILHVGLLADLEVDVEIEEASPSQGVQPPASCDEWSDSLGAAPLEPCDYVTITVTASNDGPDTGESTKVDVSLPDGLEYSEHTTVRTDTVECPDPNGGSTPTQETYCPGTGVWAVGDLLNGDTETLTITATVAYGTRGQEQTVTADIYATVDIRSTKVVELDPSPVNNQDTTTITPVEDPNANPNFFIGLSVPENAPHDTHVGSRISVNEPDSGDTLHYSLEGDGKENFHLSTDGGGGVQLKVERDAVLDLDRTSEVLDLTLKVRDDEDSAGNTSQAVDDTIPVRISITPDSTGFNAQAQATGPLALAGDSTKSKATFTVTAQRLPSGSGGTATADDLRIHVVEESPDGTLTDLDLTEHSWTQNQGDATLTWHITKDVDSGRYEYTVDVWVVEGAGETLATAAARVFTVTWQQNP